MSEKEEKKVEDEIQYLNERLSPNRLVMSTVPSNTMKRFRELANEADFCQNFGMCLKYLIDFHDGIIVAGNEPLILEVEQLKERIAKLEARIEEKNEKKVVTMGDGSTKRMVK